MILNAVKVKRIVRIKKHIIQNFIEVVGGGDELKDSVLLFLYPFGFFLVYDTLLCVFVLMVIRKLSEDVGFNSNIKDNVYGDELLQIFNLAYFFFI